MLLKTPSKAGTVTPPPPVSGFTTPKPPYQLVATEVSFIPNEMYPWPEDQIRQIRVFDPIFVPVWRRMVYRTPAGGEAIFFHHGFCHWNPNKPQSPVLIGAMRPMTGFFARFPLGRRPNVWDRWFQNPEHIRPGSERANNQLPPPFIPWGDWVLAWARDTYWDASAAEKMRFIEERGAEARRAKATKAACDEAAYRVRHDQAYDRKGELYIDPEPPPARPLTPATRPHVFLGGAA